MTRVCSGAFDRSEWSSPGGVSTGWVTWIRSWWAAGSDAEWNEARAVVPAWNDGEVPDGDLGRVEMWGGESDAVDSDVSELVNGDGSM